jgi:hypothetical protein
MIRASYISRKVVEMSALPFFPGDQDARLMIMRVLSEMVRNAGREPGDTETDAERKDEAALDWLVRRAVNLWSRWEGVRELRAIYCARFRPGDGIETTSALYVDGVPADPTLPPRPALPAAAELAAWPKEELEAVQKAWAERNRKSPAQQRREAMRTWLDVECTEVTALGAEHDDAMIGVAVLGSNRKQCWMVYDQVALIEGLEDREGLSPEAAVEAVANLSADVLLFYRPPGERMRPAMRPSVTQTEIDQALAVARARREGWTPERLAEIQTEAMRREGQNNDRD